MINFKKEPFELFWYWINERHAIWHRRTHGRPWPWTNDHILRTYRFCNVYRMLDTETVNLHTRLKKIPKIDILFNVILFRTFNWTPTYDAIGGWTPHQRWSPAYTKDVLQARKHNGKKVVTGAYMITNGGKPGSKIDMLADAIEVARNKLPEILSRITALNTMQGAVEVFKELPMVGVFVGYEFACDLRYTSVLRNATDVLTWANPGPGARRGINRLLGRPASRPYLPPEELQEAMQTLLRMAPHKLNKSHLSHKFEMREIEHSLCEFDKYSRVMNNEGRPRSKYHHVKA